MTTSAHYTVLARRFRPQAFEDVVGQEHVSRALRNAIRSGRVAHAYMFTGARGVGKTSTARILAKALNCPHTEDGVPCNQCEICEGISAGNDVDVLEIDGASNRGIDDIRSLRASVGVRSMRTRFKVYIIDEVHMLTREAFNALLKTLEEPPPNVKFVFCTTEPNKVPDTILSRCQRFDFSSIDDQSIGERLREIARAEGFEVEDDAIELVARRARGSMRDSQSLFDQLLAFSDGTVTADDVHRMLGTAGDERLVEFFEAITERRPGEVLALLDSAFSQGVQPGELMDQCISYLRDMMVTVSGGSDVALISVSNRHRETLRTQAGHLGMTTILAAFQILADAKNRMFRSTFARTVMEMAMVQLSLLENLTALSDLLSGRLPAIPDQLAAGGEPAPRRSGNVPSPAGNSGQAASNIPAVADRHAVTSSSEEKKNALNLTGDSPLQESSVDLTGSDPIQSAASGGGSNEPPRNAGSGSQTDSRAAEESGDNADKTSSSPALMRLTAEDCPRLFQELLRTVGLTVSAGLKMASEMVVTGPNRIEFCFDRSSDFARKILEVPDNRARVEDALQKLTGQRVTYSLRLITGSGTEGTGLLTAENAEAGKPGTASRMSSSEASTRPESTDGTLPQGDREGESGKLTTRKARSGSSRTERPPERNLVGDVNPGRDPFVREVMEAFGATVVRITAAPAVTASDQDE